MRILYKKRTQKAAGGTKLDGFNPLETGYFADLFGSMKTNAKSEEKLIDTPQDASSGVIGKENLLAPDILKNGIGEGTAGTEMMKANQAFITKAAEPPKIVEPPKTGGVGGLMDNLGGASNVTGIAGMAAGVAGDMLSGVDNGDDTYDGNEKAADISSSALSGAAAGAQFGAWGMAAGAVIGTAKGFIDAEGKEADYRALRRDNAKGREQEGMSSAQSLLGTKTANITSSSALLYGDKLGGNQIGYGREGLKFIVPKYTFTMPAVKDFDGKLKYLSLDAPTQIFKRGGKVKEYENVIPNGVLHEEDNELGDKGMPVIKCSLAGQCSKEYEIERDELILTLASTTKVEELVKEDDLAGLGEFVAEQLLDNTHSFTEKYDYLNGNENETIFN